MFFATCHVSRNFAFAALLMAFAGKLCTADAVTAPKRPYDATHYKITLALDPSSDPETFSAKSEMRLRALEPVDTLPIDAEDLVVKRVTQKGKTLVWDKGVVKLPRKLGKNQETTLVFEYEGKIRSQSQDGLFKVKDPDDPSRGTLLFTQFETQSARKFFPCNDQPGDKATTEIVVSVPSKYDAISNGKRMKERFFQKDSASWKEIRWSLEKPHPTYLVSLAVGSFGKRMTTAKGREVSIYMPSEKLEKADFAMNAAVGAIEFIEKYTGVMYPWPKYSIVGVPTFFWGGMENTSSTHQNQERTLLNDPGSAYEKRRIVELTAHEAAHQWFGDHVTMQWWDDLWLNESFASHLGTLASAEYLKSDKVLIEPVLEAWDRYFRQEDGPRSHPIVNAELKSVDDSFDAIAYTKGENVLRMLTFYVGEDRFKAALQLYLNSHAYGNATYVDFFRAVETASGQSLTRFRDTWLLQRGYPKVQYSWVWDGEAQTYRGELAQQSNHASEKTTFHFRVPVAFHRTADPAYDKVETVTVDGTTTSYAVKLPAEPEWVTVNPGAVVLGKFEPSKRDERLLARQATKDPDPIARIAASYQLFETWEQDETLSKTAETALLEVLQNDPSPNVRSALLTQFQKMKPASLPRRLSDGVFELAGKNQDEETLRALSQRQDRDGWFEYRAEVLGTLGKVRKQETLPFLASVLGKKDLSLDDLGKACLSVAGQGKQESAAMLRETLKLHRDRGYSYQFAIQYAFGAYESPDAASEIRELAKTCGTDLMARIGWAIRNNQTLKNSAEWAGFLTEFTLENQRFGDDVKTRLLETIEEVKNAFVKATLETVEKKSTSDRVKQLAKRILAKNFSPTGNM